MCRGLPLVCALPNHVGSCCCCCARGFTTVSTLPLSAQRKEKECTATHPSLPNTTRHPPTHPNPTHHRRTPAPPNKNKGVGKTAIAEGLAYAIVHKVSMDGSPLPEFLSQKRVMQLDVRFVGVGWGGKGRGVIAFCRWVAALWVAALRCAVLCAVLRLAVLVLTLVRSCRSPTPNQLKTNPTPQSNPIQSTTGGPAHRGRQGAG